MTTNRLAISTNTKEHIVAPNDPEARINFWIARGNAILEEQGKNHLHWVWHNGSYSIEPRPNSNRYIGHHPGGQP